MSTKPAFASARSPRFLLHGLWVLLLMWPAIVNRQPFFFSDTTSYVRAADLAVQVATQHRVTTAWSRPRVEAEAAPAAEAATGATAAVPRGSDGSGGNVMAGRSPYFGALLYLGYVTSDFWLFVVAQAIVAYLLIGFALRCFGLDRPVLRGAVVAALAVFTTLAFYCSLLLADALAGFGILAFLILATSRPLFSRGEQAFLVAVLAISVLAHLTHIVMLLGMTGMLILLVLLRRLKWSAMRWPIALGIVGVVLGLGSVMLTNQVVRTVLGKPPALVPLMTARFVADGPGRDFIEAGCEGGRFTVCHIPFTGETSTDFLWSRQPGSGVFLPADAETRTKMSAEDTAFARAVIAAYPVRQIGMMGYNTALQIASFDSNIMWEDCFARAGCNADALPPRTLAQLRQSLSGRNLWPIGLINAKDYAGVLVALLMLAVLAPKLWREDRTAAGQLLLWTGLLAIAMLINGFLGGAISEPQGRYQARIVWLVPLLAAIAWLRAWGFAAARDALPVARASR